MTKLPVAPVAILLTLSLEASAACEFERRVDREVDSSELTSLEVEARAGELTANGTDRKQIEIRATICSDQEENVEKMDVEFNVRRGVGRVVAIIPETIRSGWTTAYAYIDIDLAVPRDLPVTIRDSSGDIELRDLTVRSIDDSSGSIRVRDSRADLSLSDSSGDITLVNHKGNVQLSDSSGEIRLEEIEGRVHVERDSSGDIDITDVKGDVEIDRDSSGGIYIDRVEGGVVIDRDGSGDLEISHVRDDVRIGSDGSGDVRVTDVGGDFTVEIKGSGEIRSQQIAGNVDTP